MGYSKNSTVSFRWVDAFQEDLNTMAAEAGMRPNELARLLLQREVQRWNDGVDLPDNPNIVKNRRNQ